MQTTQGLSRIFENLDSLKTEFNHIKSQSAFINFDTNEVIPASDAAGKNLKNFKFVGDLQKNEIDHFVINKLVSIFNNEQQSSSVNEFLRENPDWFLDKPETNKSEKSDEDSGDLIVIKVTKIQNLKKKRKIRVTFEILNFPNNPHMNSGSLIYEVSYNNYYTQTVNFEKGECYNPSSIHLGEPEYYTKKIDGVTLYKFKQVRSSHYRQSPKNEKK